MGLLCKIYSSFQVKNFKNSTKNPDYLLNEFMLIKVLNLFTLEAQKNVHFQNEIHKRSSLWLVVTLKASKHIALVSQLPL